MQGCHIEVEEEDVTKLMVEEGFCHEAEAIMRVDTFKRCLLHVSLPLLPPDLCQATDTIFQQMPCSLHPMNSMTVQMAVYCLGCTRVEDCKSGGLMVVCSDRV